MIHHGNDADVIIDPRHAERRSRWWRSSAVITGEIMGTGLLSLPYAMSRLGWALGMMSSIGFGCTAIYSGRLLAACKNTMYPEATCFADLAHATGGRRFGLFTRGALVTGWALILPYYLIACASALAAAFPETKLCLWHWMLVTTALLAPLLQYRSLHGLSALSLLSTFAVIVVLLILIPALIGSHVEPAHTTIGVPPDQSFFNVYASLGSFIFAYQGQSVFLEIMREMRKPTDFPRALLVANGLMIMCYTGVSIVGYGSHGQAVEGFIPDTLPAGVARSCVGLLLAFHTAVPSRVSMDGSVGCPK